MRINDFRIERFFARHEFSARYLMSSSDCDGLSLEYLLSLASDEEAELWKNMKLGYTETRGSLFLRTAIARHFSSTGPDEIVVCSPGEANFALMNSILQPGDEVICLSPSYQSLYEVAAGIGCSISFWEAELCKNGWYFDPGKLRSLVTSKTRLIIINFPHNPTGYSPSQEDYSEIIEVAAEKGLILFSDEMYRLLMHDPLHHIPPACDLYENAVSLWGTSKSFGLAGLRLGWLTSRNPGILDKVESFKDYLSICNSPATEIPAAIALNNAEAIISKNLAVIRKNIELFKDFTARHGNFIDFPVPNSGSTCYAPVRIRITTAEFAEKTVRDTGVLLLPSEMFQHGSGHLRIGFGKESFSEGLDCLEAYLDTEEIRDLIKQ